jgi:IS30 family transposase
LATGKLTWLIGKGHKGGLCPSEATKYPWGATLAERKSRFYLALPVTNKTAQAVNDAIAKLLTPLKHWIKMLTFDNNREFS